VARCPATLGYYFKMQNLAGCSFLTDFGTTPSFVVINALLRTNYTSRSANKSSDRRNTRQCAVDLLSCSISRVSEKTIATTVARNARVALRLARLSWNQCPQTAPDTSMTMIARRRIFSGMSALSIPSISEADLGRASPFGGAGMGRGLLSPNQNTQ
jgi:hypothetical protein